MRWTPRRLRLGLNLYPPYLLAGIRIRHIDPQWRELDVAMKLRWYNQNAVGTHFGGSLFAMVDPHLMLLLMQLLGRDYMVWDQSATIHFKKPGRGLVTAKVRITDEQLGDIRAATADGSTYRPEYELTIRDENDEVVATVLKTLYIRRKKT